MTDMANDPRDAEGAATIDEIPDVAPDDERLLVDEVGVTEIPDHLDAPFEVPVPDMIDQWREVPLDTEEPDASV